MAQSEIHVTDVQTFLRCRRLWDWQSQLRRGLQPAGIPAPLFLGQGVHIALDKYYSTPADERTPSLLLLAYHDWVDARTERMKKRTGPLWRDEREMVGEMRSLGAGMLLHYYLWSLKRDTRYTFISTEEKFNVAMPMPWPKTTSSTSLNYAGRFDGVIRDKETDDLYLMEFKTTRSMRNMQWTYRSLQGTAYVWAAQRLLGKRVKGIMYRVLLKKLPTGPQKLVNGGYSQAKSQKSSFEWFVYCLDKIADRLDVDPQSIYKENETILRHLHGSGNDFFDQKVLIKTPQQIRSIMKVLYHVGRQMHISSTPIFPQPGFHCSWCSFADPCTLKMMGGDWEGLLEAEYAPRDYWEEEEDDEG